MEELEALVRARNQHRDVSVMLSMHLAILAVDSSEEPRAKGHRSGGIDRKQG